MTAGKGAPEPGRGSMCVTQSEEETYRLGVDLAGRLKVPGVVLMSGALGAGKTTLARGIAAGLGIPDPAAVHSPSFTIVNVYRGRCPIYHVDLYRLEGGRDLHSIGLEDFIGSDGITLVEWSERLELELPGALVVELEDAGGDTRRIWILEAAACPGRRESNRRQSGRRPKGSSGASKRGKGKTHGE